MRCALRMCLEYWTPPLCVYLAASLRLGFADTAAIYFVVSSRKYIPSSPCGPWGSVCASASVCMNRYIRSDLMRRATGVVVSSVVHQRFVCCCCNCPCTPLLQRWNRSLLELLQSLVTWLITAIILPVLLLPPSGLIRSPQCSIPLTQCCAHSQCAVVWRSDRRQCSCPSLALSNHAINKTQRNAEDR